MGQMARTVMGGDDEDSVQPLSRLGGTEQGSAFDSFLLCDSDIWREEGTDS